MEMKRLGLLLALAALLAQGVVAQDISGLGGDFENLIEELGQEVLPNLEELAIWGQFPGSASVADKTGFFMTLSTGAVLSNGVFRFADDPTAFDVLNVPNLLNTALGADPALQGAVDFIQAFFPYPIIRLAMGFTLPYEIEAMIDVTGWPQFITGFVGGLAGLDTLNLSSFHVTSKIRKAIIKDAGPFPAISIGAGYGFSGMSFGLDLAAADVDGDGYGDITVGLGELNLKGALLVQGAVHTFGIDLQASKAFGVFVPFLGLSSYYHIAQFAGNVGTASTFEAFIDYGDGGSPQDVVYTGDHPETAWIDNDLSMVLFGGFDLDLGNFAFQVHSAWNIMKSWPGVTLGARWQ
jgi:hypothetical protein